MVFLFLSSALEFIYAQSPESMKGLLTGLFFFLFGIISIPSSVVFYAYSGSTEDQKLVRLHGAFAIIQVTDTFSLN